MDGALLVWNEDRVSNICSFFFFFSFFFVCSHVYNYCTTSRPPAAGRGATKGISGANFVGEELYNRLVEFLKKHMRGLLKVYFSAIAISCCTCGVALHLVFLWALHFP